ncbi:MAG: hypothetical protein JJT87_19390 [Halomonas sp.]|nr:hypothetical protein [Halomonas sp.]MCC5904081.1 hypothetical protein [Halomonas sp.]
MLSQILSSLVSLIIGGVAGHYLAFGRDTRNHYLKCADIPRKKISTAILTERYWIALEGGVLEEMRYLLSDSAKSQLAVLEADFKVTCQRLANYSGPGGTTVPPAPEDMRRAKILLEKIDELIKAPPWWRINLR